MKKLLFFLPLFLLADVNPFNAGNLNSPNPYGLTPQEKAILHNKKSIENLKEEVESLKNDINKLSANLAQKFVSYDETISDLKNKSQAMQTIIDEIDTFNKNVINLKKRVSNLENNLSNLEKNVAKLNNNYSTLNNNYLKLKGDINQIIKVQNQNFQYLTNSIKDILKQIKQINIPPKKAFFQAKKLYFNGKLDEAKKLFLISLNYNYMPATSSFYLGEIEYKNKNYKKALAFYKKSISLYPHKTSFTSKLLFHTGLSFEKLGLINQAKLTFKKLINDFHKSKYSSLAKKQLVKLR